MAPKLPQRASWAATTSTHSVKESSPLLKGDKRQSLLCPESQISETGLAESVVQIGIFQ